VERLDISPPCADQEELAVEAKVEAKGRKEEAKVIEKEATPLETVIGLVCSAIHRGTLPAELNASSARLLKGS